MSPRRRVVVDASVAAKWLLPEPGSDAATSLLEDDVAFHVPELFDAELANVLWKRRTRDELTADETMTLAALIGDIPARRHRHGALIEGAVALAMRLSITVYDALYVALAHALDARLVTADRVLADRARNLVDLVEL